MQTKRIEKEHWADVCRERCLGAKAEAAAVAAKRWLEFETLLEKMYSPDNDDSHLGRLYTLAKSRAATVNKEIARLAEEFGMDLQFGPSLKIDYGSWSDYAQRGSEQDWCTAKRKIGTLEREAAAQIERIAMDTLIRLMHEDFTPDEATAIVHAIPTAAELVPELKREDLRDRDVEEGRMLRARRAARSATAFPARMAAIPESCSQKNKPRSRPLASSSPKGENR